MTRLPTVCDQNGWPKLLVIATICWIAPKPLIAEQFLDVETVVKQTCKNGADTDPSYATDLLVGAYIDKSSKRKQIGLKLHTSPQPAYDTGSISLYADIFDVDEKGKSQPVGKNRVTVLAALTPFLVFSNLAQQDSNTAGPPYYKLLPMPTPEDVYTIQFQSSNGNPLPANTSVEFGPPIVGPGPYLAATANTSFSKTNSTVELRCVNVDRVYARAHDDINNTYFEGYIDLTLPNKYAQKLVILDNDGGCSGTKGILKDCGQFEVTTMDTSNDAMDVSQDENPSSNTSRPSKRKSDDSRREDSGSNILRQGRFKARKMRDGRKSNGRKKHGRPDFVFTEDVVSLPDFKMRQ